MKKTTKLPRLLKSLCIVSLAFSVPLKAPASSDCCASWAIAGGVIWGGGMACAAVLLCTIQGCKALSQSCDNCFQSLYKWIDKKKEESSSQSTPLMKQVNGPSKKYGEDKNDTPLPSIIYESQPRPTRQEEDSLHGPFIPLPKSASTSNLFADDEA